MIINEQRNNNYIKMENKNYRQMTNDEQIEVIKQVADYIHTDLPKLQSLGMAFDAEAQNTFFRGVKILSVFESCRSFCAQTSNLCANWDQYTNRMAYLFNIVKKRIASEMQIENRGQKVIVLPQSQSLRRGRPTEYESRQREKDRQLAERAQAISLLTGAKLATQESAPIDTNRPTDTSRRKEGEQDLFGSAIEAEISSTEETQTSDSSLCSVKDDSSNKEQDTTSVPTLKSLREWIWLMPSTMADKVKNLRDTIGQRDYEAQQAKMMAERGESETEIQMHTIAARDINMDIRDLYADIDDLLGLYYVMLTKVNKDYGKLAVKYEKHGGYDVLVNDLLPYYTKMSESKEGWADNALIRAQAMEAKRVADETKNPDIEKEIHKIKAYFKRTDMKISAKRLNVLKDYLVRAEELGIDADTIEGFKVIIETESEQLSK